ncbi:hypothetical protein DUNSADRAFT_9644, partial [Dunaliella salina]
MTDASAWCRRCKALDSPSPFAAPMPPSPLSPGSFAFGPQAPARFSPQRAGYIREGRSYQGSQSNKPRPSQESNQLEGASSCHLPKSKSACLSNNGGADYRRWSLTGPSGRDPFSTLPVSPFQTQRLLMRENSGTLCEEVLLH